MAYCSKCGTKLAEDDGFCFNCGQPVYSNSIPSNLEETKVTNEDVCYCGACGNKVSKYAIVCLRCGNNLIGFHEDWGYEDNISISGNNFYVPRVRKKSFLTASFSCPKCGSFNIRSKLESAQVKVKTFEGSFLYSFFRFIYIFFFFGWLIDIFLFLIGSKKIRHRRKYKYVTEDIKIYYCKHCGYQWR